MNGKGTSTGKQEDILKLTSKCIWWIYVKNLLGSFLVLSDTDNMSKNICLTTATVAFEVFPKLSAQLWQGFRFVSDLLLEIYY